MTMHIYIYIKLYIYIYIYNQINVIGFMSHGSYECVLKPSPFRDVDVDMLRQPTRPVIRV